ncbi:MAG: hypothetical protein KJ852_14085 [Gammaproteobacteria bacterium]|jgi:UDPglucose 6-dehydrogenase|nr:hypothetical protein [Gammaproteobacteria bacterium]MBU0788466.1 hypothetical protein [Gammaproteobacteria bacterium]MBU0816445.1 hypothetical protein [Gammaproteobacteria bacterium]MBU1788082.1 hypothetical protein [Gammaproteobacteria bacterium]
MKLTILGTDHVGLVTGARLAELENHVGCLNVDAEKMALLHCAVVPFHEAGLGHRIQRSRVAVLPCDGIGHCSAGSDARA